MTSTRTDLPDWHGFVGAKGALFCGGDVLVYLRDDKPGLPWRNLWDLPGGGREGDETPEACFLRELHEEFGLSLPPKRLVFRRVLPSMTDPARPSAFFAGRLTLAETAAIRFGDEGQHWQMMAVEGFLTHDGAVPEMQRRTAIAWAALGGGPGQRGVSAALAQAAGRR